MASDIVERLGDRIIADAFVAGHITSGPLAQRLARERGEAKDEIARLRAENKKLRAALKPFADAARPHKNPTPDFARALEVYDSTALQQEVK